MWALFAVYQAVHTLIGAAVDATGIPPDTISFPHALAAATDSVTAGFPPHQADLALATFLLKILDPAFFVRDRPDRASPRATKKAQRLPPAKINPASSASPDASKSTASAPDPQARNARPLGGRPGCRRGKLPPRSIRLSPVCSNGRPPDQVDVVPASFNLEWYGAINVAKEVYVVSKIHLGGVA